MIPEKAHPRRRPPLPPTLLLLSYSRGFSVFRPLLFALEDEEACWWRHARPRANLPFLFTQTCLFFPIGGVFFTSLSMINFRLPRKYVIQKEKQNLLWK